MSPHDLLAHVISYALQSGLLLAVGLLLPRLLRLRHPALLLTYWRVLLVVVVLLPLVLSLSPRQAPSPIFALEGLTVDAVVDTLPAAVPERTWETVLLVLAAGALLGLFRLGLGIIHLHRCRSSATLLEPLPHPVEGVRRRLGLRVPFLVSEGLPAPITFGWLHPTVLVPPAFHELSEDAQEGVACHELLHVKRGDWLMTLLEEIVRACLWFHPAVWVLLAKVALTREQVVDAAAVRVTGNRRQYLDALWQVVCGSRTQASLLAVPMAGKSHLFERVALLQKETVMSRARVVFSVVILGVMLAAAGAVGAAAFSPGGAVAPAAAEKPDQTEEAPPRPVAETKCGEITEPVAVEKVRPQYPEEARKAKVMGTVLLDAVITEEGVVDQVKVVESPDEQLAEAAVAAVKQWRFDPALCDGEPVAVWYKLTINFKLQ
jgi:TonB family protein